MLDVVTAAWETWWLFSIVVDAVVLWLFVMALVLGSTTGPLSSDDPLSALERVAARGARVRGSTFDPRQQVIEVGQHTSAFIARFGARTERVWRSSRGLFLPARLLAWVAGIIGVAQFLFTLLVFVPRLSTTAWVFISFGILLLDLLCVFAVLIAERRHWRRRAPFEMLLTRSLMQATRWSRKEPTWSDARSLLAEVERVLAERFLRVRDRPLSAVPRDLEWTRRIKPWADGLARLDLRLEAPGERPTDLLAAQIEAAVRLIERSSKRSRVGPLVDAPAEKRRLDPQTRLGVTLVLFIGATAVFFVGLGTLELALNDRNQLPSADEVGSWLTLIGPAVSLVAAVAGGVGWLRRWLSPAR